MNIYLVGHGYLANNVGVAINVPHFRIPANLTLKFYCPAGKPFDSSWEAAVTSGDAEAQGFSPATAPQDWEVSVFPAGSECADHLLVRPGSMKTLKALVDMKEIRTDVAAGSMISQPLVDADTLCIKKGSKPFGPGPRGANNDGLPYAYLSDIIVSLNTRNLGAATVHWCACRSPRLDEPEIREQGASSWSGKL